MKQQDVVINSIPVIINTDESGMWTEDFLMVLKQDATEKEVKDVINYLYEEGFILDRKIQYKIV
tara:strand:- start:984 stop:1175 length:192 start_codon:yes stop_codon:yes gene_type:complete